MAEPDLHAIVQRMIDAGESEENIATVIQSAKRDTAPSVAVPTTAIGMAGAAASVPVIAKAAVEAATNPNVAKTGAQIGRVIGGVAPTVIEAAQGNGMGALTAAALSGKTSWAGGKAGWFTAKLAQELGVPVAKIAEAIAPYAQGLSTLSGAQGVNDLAQMAEPNRSDIGVLGVGKTDSLANDRAAVMMSQIRALTAQGLSVAEASRKVSEAWKGR